MNEPESQPRPNDHLVEPLYGGLQGADSPGKPARRGLWIPWLAGLLAVACLIAVALSL